MKANLWSRAAQMCCCKTGCKKVCMYERGKKPPGEATLCYYLLFSGCMKIGCVWKSDCLKANFWSRAAHMRCCKTVCKKAKQKVDLDQCKLSLLKKGSNSIVKMAEPKRKRRVLTLCQRLQIIKAVEDYPNKTRTQIAIDFGVPLPTLSNIVKEKKKYLAQATSGDVITTTKRARTSQLGSVDKALLEWFTSCRWVTGFSHLDAASISVNTFIGLLVSWSVCNARPVFICKDKKQNPKQNKAADYPDKWKLTLYMFLHQVIRI